MPRMKNAAALEAEIAKCLNCQRPDCIDCLGPGRREYPTKRPVPEGFAEDIRNGVTALELARKYQASRCTVQDWKKVLAAADPSIPKPRRYRKRG